MTTRSGKGCGTLLGVLLAVFGLPHPGQGQAFFSQTGISPPLLGPGQGVEFVLGGTQRPGVIEPSLVFHLHLFFNEGHASGPSMVTFSPGDVLRFKMDGTSIIYEFDDGGNILTPPMGQSGFFNGGNTDDNFPAADPIGLAFAAADTNGHRFSLEVLAGDGVRFAGLEFSDTLAGTFQMGGASTLMRRFDVNSGETVLLDFESLNSGDVVQGQFQDKGITFLGDRIVDEQVLINRFGEGLDGLERRMLINQSTTPPLGRSGFVGIEFDRPVARLQFNFVGPNPTLVGAFSGAFSGEDFLFSQQVSPSPTPGPGGLLEGSATFSYPSGFDRAIIAPPKGAASKGILLDNLTVKFLEVAVIDFEGMSEGTEVRGQFGGLGVSFFGDTVLDEQDIIDQGGVGYTFLEGGLLLNSSTTPPMAEDGFLGITFDAPVRSVSFDYSGPSPLRVFSFRGDLAVANIVGTQDFFTTTSPTGFPEGKATIIDPTGIDGLVIAEHGSVVIDNLVVTYVP